MNTIYYLTVINIMTMSYFSKVIVLSLLVACKHQPSSKITNKEDTVKISAAQKELKTTSDENPKDHPPSGYNELANEANYERFVISDFNTDLDEIPNIERPSRSHIENPALPTHKLFGTWVQDPGPETPHATFSLDEKSFYVVDYDGDGNMPYIIKNDSITVYYNDFIIHGKLIESENPEELIIHWQESDHPTTYYTWEN